MLEKITKPINQFLFRVDPFNYVDRLLDQYYPVPKKGEPPLVQTIVYQLVYLLTALIVAVIIYGAASLVLQTSSPIVVVVSESMEPQLFRGDLVVIQGVSFENLKADLVILPYSLQGKFFADFVTPHYDTKTLSFTDSSTVAHLNLTNDIVVYNSPLLGKQIIHRAQAKIASADGQFVLTKGDNAVTNPAIDQDCGLITIVPNNATPTVQLRPAKACVNPIAPPISEVLGKAVLRVPLVGCFKLWLFDDLPTLVTRQRLPTEFRGIC